MFKHTTFLFSFLVISWAQTNYTSAGAALVGTNIGENEWIMTGKVCPTNEFAKMNINDKDEYDYENSFLEISNWSFSIPSSDLSRVHLQFTIEVSDFDLEEVLITYREGQVEFSFSSLDDGIEGISESKRLSNVISDDVNGVTETVPIILE